MRHDTRHTTRNTTTRTQPHTTTHNHTQRHATTQNTHTHNNTHNTHNTQHNTTQHNTTQHNTTQHNTTQHTTHTIHKHTHNIDISFHGLPSHVMCHRFCLNSQTVLEQKQWNRRRVAFEDTLQNRSCQTVEIEIRFAVRCPPSSQHVVSSDATTPSLLRHATSIQNFFCSMESPLQAKMGCNSGQWDVVEDLYRRHLMVPSCLPGTSRVFLTLFWTASLCDREVCAWRFSSWFAAQTFVLCLL